MESTINRTALFPCWIDLNETVLFIVGLQFVSFSKLLFYFAFSRSKWNFPTKKNTHIDLWKQATEILEWVSNKLDKQFGCTMCLCGDSFHQIVINFIRFPLFRNEIALQFFILSAECDNCWYSPATESLSIHMQLLLLLWFSSKLNMKFSFDLCWLREFMKIAISTDG